MRDTQNTIFNSYVFNDNLFPANNFNVTCNMIIYINLIIYILRSDRQEFSNLLRNAIISCIADLEGSPDRALSHYSKESKIRRSVPFILRGTSFTFDSEFCIKMPVVRHNRSAASCDFERFSAILSVCRATNAGIIRDN
jgi:hypothetical protein